jgi:hypothetical protein
MENTKRSNIRLLKPFYAAWVQCSMWNHGWVTVKLDGTPPGEDHGSDTDASGTGTVQGHRLYQLIRQKGTVEDRTFEIEFLDPDVQAFAFTFG